MYLVYLTQILPYICGYRFFSSIFDKHAPYCIKRVKTRWHNHWLDSEIKFQSMHRNWFLQHSSRDEYKKTKK